ncbi:MAG: hypothetical protein V1821_02415 [bacterium]
MDHHDKPKVKAHVVAVDMGYGHERAAHGLLDIAHGQKYWIANNYVGIPESEHRLWKQGKSFYEIFSRIKSVPIIGNTIFKLLIDRQQTIPNFYPKRDMSEPTSQVKQTYFLIEKLGMCKHLIQELEKNPLPLICTFFTPAFAAEYYGYPNDIYITICDADMSRAWVSRDPKKSRIKYFAPTGRVVERLKLYGVPAKNIFHTGFPLPKSNVGGASMRIINPDLLDRLAILDPNRIYYNRYHETLDRHFGRQLMHVKPKRRLAVTFAVGGAGAQREIGITAVASLALRLKRGELDFHLIAGHRPEVASYFEEEIQKLGLEKQLGKSIHIMLGKNRREYFDKFDELLRKTDILWTKPSELSFFVGIGIPIIMAPPIGSQEDFNKRWLYQVGAGIRQNDPRYTSEWLFDWVNSGGLARAAWNGFIEAPTHGTYRIEDVISKRKSELEILPMII